MVKPARFHEIGLDAAEEGLVVVQRGFSTQFFDAETRRRRAETPLYYSVFSASLRLCVEKLYHPMRSRSPVICAT